MNQTEAEQQSTGESQAAEFGASLREIRLAHQRELTDVSEDLRIRQVFLNAIEEGRFDDLPGPAYAVGFVRAYADYLGLDVEAVVSQFKTMGGGSGRQAHLVPPSPVSEGRLPTGSVLLVAAVLAAGAYGGWYYLSLDGRAGMDGVAALPQRIAALVGMQTEAEAPQPPAVPAEMPKPEEPAGATDGHAAKNEPGAETGDAPAAETVEPVDQGSADPADSDPQPNQGDAGLTQPQTPPEPEPVESAAAPETTVPETPAVASAAVPPPAPEPVPAPVAAPAPAPQPAVTAEPPPAPAPDPAPVAQAEPVRAVPASMPEPAPAPVSEPPSAAETAEPAAAMQITAIAPASSAAPETPAEIPAAPAMPETTPPATATTAATGDSASTAPQTASVPPEATFEPQVRITLRAATNSWVEVLKKNGNTVFSRMMLSGEAVDLPIGPGMTLSTGNAGGIEILLDGEALPPLGTKGEVRRNVALDAESLRQTSGGAR